MTCVVYFLIHIFVHIVKRFIFEQKIPYELYGEMVLKALHRKAKRYFSQSFLYIHFFPFH